MEYDSQIKIFLRVILFEYYSSRLLLAVQNNITLMQQLEYCKKKLDVPSFPETKIKEYGYAGSYEVIGIATIAALVWTLATGDTFAIYLVNGLLLPLLFRHYGCNFTNYWECFAVLLLLRRLSSRWAMLDAVVLICLWHPNIRLGDEIVKRITAIWPVKK